MDEIIKTNRIGSELFDLLVFERPDDDNFSGEFDLEIDDYSVSFSNSKNIVITAPQGREDTVKELISNGDYTISVRGFLHTWEINEAPHDMIRAFKQYMDYNGQLSVVNGFFNDMQIETVIVQRYTLGQQDGVRNLVPFTIEMLSDQPLVLQLRNENV